MRAIVGHLARAGVIQPAPSPPGPRARAGRPATWDGRALALCRTAAQEGTRRAGASTARCGPGSRATRCRRAGILRHFGDRRRRRRPAPCCDVCDPALRARRCRPVARRRGAARAQLAQRPRAAGDAAALDEAIVEVVAAAGPRSAARARSRSCAAAARRCSLKHAYDGLPHYGTFGHLAGAGGARARRRAARGRARCAPAAAASRSWRRMRVRVGVLASGVGSNLRRSSIASTGATASRSSPSARTSPRRARSSARARRGVAAQVFPPRATATAPRATRRWPAGWRSSGVELVVLAGYMQLLTPAFLARFPQRVVNVHPALLPGVPGAHAVEQAVAYGVKVFGVTVHFVDEGVDTGPIIAQRAVELPDGGDRRRRPRRAAPARARPADRRRRADRPRRRHGRSRRPAPRSGATVTRAADTRAGRLIVRRR